MRIKLGFIGMFRLTQTPVGSDALVAPPRRTYLYVSGVEAEKIYLTMDKSNFQVAERRGRRSLQWVIGNRAIVSNRPLNPNLNHINIPLPLSGEGASAGNYPTAIGLCRRDYFFSSVAAAALPPMKPEIMLLTSRPVASDRPSMTWLEDCITSRSSLVELPSPYMTILSV